MTSEGWHPLGLVLGVGLGVLLTSHSVTSAQDFRAYLPQANNQGDHEQGRTMFAGERTPKIPFGVFVCSPPCSPSFEPPAETAPCPIASEEGFAGSQGNPCPLFF
jgi:hypothetical protein